MYLPSGAEAQHVGFRKLSRGRALSIKGPLLSGIGLPVSKRR